jgi:hypothetical protein
MKRAMNMPNTPEMGHEWDKWDIGSIGGVWGSLVSQFLSILEPVHDGKKVEDIGLPIRLAQEFPQFSSKKQLWSFRGIQETISTRKTEILF